MVNRLSQLNFSDGRPHQLENLPSLTETHAYVRTVRVSGLGESVGVVRGGLTRDLVWLLVSRAPKVSDRDNDTPGEACRWALDGDRRMFTFPGPGGSASSLECFSITSGWDRTTSPERHYSSSQLLPVGLSKTRASVYSLQVKVSKKCRFFLEPKNSATPILEKGHQHALSCSLADP